MLKLFPAVDVRGGHAVRLYQGDYSRETVYENRPLDAAKRFFEEGGEYLHAVDLDGAKEGKPVNFREIGEMIRFSGMKTEVGGGIRTEDDIKMYLDMGALRVILGTAALENRNFLLKMVEKYAEKIAVGVDAKNGFVATRGWLDVSDVNAFDFMSAMRDAGVKNAIFTDISKDGAMQGTNLEAYRELSKIESLNVVASGGISSYEEILTLDKMGISGAILGKSLYTGALNLKKALDCLREGRVC